ncbi:MAG: Ig-like domain-containing protein, partial [Nitrosarchaeum sp.]
NFAGSGTTYTFDVLRGSSDGTVVVSIAGGTATDTAGNPNTASNVYTLTINTVSPTVTITLFSTNSTVSSYIVTFSESVSDFDISDITVTGTANGGFPAASNFAGSGTTYTFDVLRGSSDGTVVVSIAGGTATDAFGNSNTASNISIVTIAKSGNGSNVVIKPTFGKVYATDNQYVIDGFGYGTFAKTITDNFHTEFLMVEIPTGTEYPFYAKGYFANGIQSQEFCFGIPEAGKGYLAESCVEVYFDSGNGNDKKITNIKVIQNTNVISDVVAQHEMANCNAYDTGKPCDKTMITVSFLEPLQNSVMMIKGIDLTRESTETYLNEGFNVSGKQFTELPSVMIPSPTKYEGLIKVTQSEKYSNTWITDDGRAFDRNDFGSFTWTNQSFDSVQNKRVSDILVDLTIKNALKEFDASKLEKSDKGFFSHDFSALDHREITLQKLGWTKAN